MKASDFGTVCNMLKEEGETHEYTYLNPSNTFIIYDWQGMVGFFNMKLEHVISDKPMPVLRHFVVKKNRRSMKMSRAAIKMYQKYCRDMGFRHTIVAAKKEHMNRVIKYYFRKEPYAENKGVKFYCVEV